MLDGQPGVFEMHDPGVLRTASPDRTAAKAAFDLGLATVLLLLLVPMTIILLLLNPFLNRGPLWFVQDRMGYGCKRFTAIKFRTMVTAAGPTRGAFDGLETHRITVLGRVLRKTRIDELPQIINVLRGEMSLIGPRPDAFDHARVYLQVVPGYRARHVVRPGISGLAQTEVGYVDGVEGLRRKVATDLHYIANMSFRLDVWILWRTLVVVLTGRGV